MPRKPRLEVEGGLYHVMTRGNNRQRIFGDDDDYRRMLMLIEEAKMKLPFYLYAYCLMPNHIHLLMERQQSAISRIMHQTLTKYSRYYNRRNRRVGHLFQKRYKSILCQSDQYLAELVRYIHLNPVRAGMVNDPASFRYSSHRAYLGKDRSGLVDVEPVLRHFGATKRLARERYIAFVKGGMRFGRQNELYGGEDERVLGSEEFIESMKKHVGDIGKGKVKKITGEDLEELMEAVAEATGLTREEICSGKKKREVVIAREALIIVGREMGASNADLARLIGRDSSVVCRRFESGRIRLNESKEMKRLIKKVIKRNCKTMRPPGG